MADAPPENSPSPAHQSASTADFLRSLAFALATLLISAALLLTGQALLSPQLAHLKAEAIRVDARPWTFRGADLIARIGQGEETPDKHLRITALEKDVDNRAIFSRRTSLRAADYPFLEHRITGRNPETRFYFIWRTEDAPDTVRNAVLPWTGDASATALLAKNKAWKGTIIEVGLDIYGDLREQAPIVEYLTLEPGSSPVMLQAIWSEWTGFREWTQLSAHHLRGAADIPILSPTLVAAGWSALTLLLLFLVNRFRKKPGTLSYITAIAAPWLALDVLWQSNLSTQLTETQYLFGGKSQHQKHLAELDPDLYEYARHLKSGVLPEPGARIFLLHNSEHRTYRRLKAQYYLFPHNTYNYSRYPRPDLSQPGDYILALEAIPGLSFRENAQTLSWGKQSLPAQQIDQHAMGTLYRVGSRND